MQSVLQFVSIVLIGSGLVFYLGAAVGLVRFPDFYTRMHAAGKGDTLSSLLIVLGLAIHMMGDPEQANWFVFFKLIAICVFIMLTSPVSTHALMDAGYEDGIRPKLKDGASDDLEMK
jgi:multicomponent Na+:H+ antiporter subunit G